MRDQSGECPGRGQECVKSKLPAIMAVSLLLMIAPSLHAAPALICKLPGTARNLEAAAVPGGGSEDHGWTVAASLALNGVAFVDLTEPVRVEVHPEWRTLHALPLTSDDFLLAGRDGKIHRVQRSGVDASFAETAAWEVESIPNFLAVQGETLIVAAGAAGIGIYHWPDHDAAPRLRGRYPFVDFSKEVAWPAGSPTLFVADNLDYGLQALDVSDLFKPRQQAFRKTSFVDTVSVQGSLAAVTGRSAGIFVYDVTNPAKPDLVHWRDLPAEGVPYRRFAEQVRFVGDGMLVCCEGSAGATLLSVERKEGLTVARTLDHVDAEGGGFRAACAIGDRTVLAANDGSLFMAPWDVSSLAGRD